MPKRTQDRALGLIALTFGLFIALYWAGADSETGVIEKARGRYTIGDAMAPTVAGALLALSGLWLCFAPAMKQTFKAQNLGFLAVLLATLFVCLATMRWGGPWLVEAFTGSEYRPLRDTVPWKYAGFVLGGTMMISALIFIVERQFRWSRLAIALSVALLLAFLYDVPFDDLLLPPNGDV